MSFGVSFRINSGCKMFLSVQQCTRSSVTRNEKYLFCRDYNVFTKSPELFSVVRFSQHTPKIEIICKEVWRSNAFFKRQSLIPLGCNSYSDEHISPNNDESKSEPDKNLSLTQKLKLMYKKYWYVLVPVHVITSSLWFGSFYYAAASGIDVPAIMENLGAPESWIQNLRDSKAGNVVLAYTLYKVATPLRYTVTIGGTTISINYLKKRGWIKPVPNTDAWKKMYNEKKGALEDLRITCHDKMQVTKNEILKTKNEMQKQFREAKEELHKSVKESRQDFKECVEDGAEEWRFIRKGVKRSVQKSWDGFFNGKK